ncbi:MAG: N-glycosylase/DNA lyase [Candidatus Nanoarchaeia archaeon]
MDEEILTLETLKQHHKKVKSEIQKKLEEFSKLKNSGDKEIFRELCFCILTAGTSAELGIKTINHIGDVIFYGLEEEIVNKLKKVYRFYNLRGRFIFLARDSFNNVDFSLGPLKLRDNIVENIKGISYKEASHFLRNIGYKGYAILDKHIVNCLFELGVINSRIPPKNRIQYLDVEEAMRSFALRNGIDFDELDLVLWSWKTGKVLK